MTCKYKIITIAISLLLLSLASSAQAVYRVGGLVEFSYRNFGTKVGDQASSSYDFTQYYSSYMSTDLWDPRFLQMSAGIHYSRIDGKGNFAQDSLGYDVNLLFFPRMKFSGQVFANQNTTNYPNNANIRGYDLTSTSHGASLFIRPYAGSKGGARGNTDNNNNNNANNNYNNNNNNNNNYNNNNNSYGNYAWGRSRTRWLPNDISLDYTHTDAVSSSMTSLSINESNDLTHARISYFRAPMFVLELDDRLEKYENRANNSSYQLNTLQLNSSAHLSPDADGTFSALNTARDTQNILGYAASETSQTYSAGLNFREKARFTHNYQYTFTAAKTYQSKNSSQNLNARAQYRWIDTISLNGLLTGSELDSTLFSTPSSTSVIGSSKMTSITAAGGLTYGQVFRPDALGAFAVSTGYSFMPGYRTISSDTGLGDGNGYTYSNSLSLALESPGWDRDKLGANYSYYSSRDHSPADMNSHTEIASMNISTMRIPRTTLQASGQYTVMENSASVVAANAAAVVAETKDRRRATTYQASARHQVNANLEVTVGATQGRTTTQQFTLSTLAATSSSIIDERTYYGEANYFQAFTPLLTLQVSAREELKDKLPDGHAGQRVIHYFNSALRYQIRQLFFSLEYNWRQYAQKEVLRTTQQMYYFKLSRPF